MRAPVYKDHKEAARLAECLGQLTSQTLLDLDFLRRCEEPERRGRKQLDRYVLRGHEFLVYPGNPKGNKSLPREDRMPRMDWDRFSDRLDACALWKRFYRMSKDSFFELLALVRPELERDTEKGDNASFDGVVTPEQRLSITLRYLAGGAYQDICLIHGIVTSTFYDVVKTTLIALDACPALEISFPLYDEQGLIKLASGFQNIAPTHTVFNSVVGALDGWLCPCVLPNRKHCKNPMAFATRKDMFAWNVQAICGKNGGGGSAWRWRAALSEMWWCSEHMLICPATLLCCVQMRTATSRTLASNALGASTTVMHGHSATWLSACVRVICPFLGSSLLTLRTKVLCRVMLAGSLHMLAQRMPMRASLCANA